MVRRLDIIASHELDHFVALVHGLLDQRVTAERADHVQARHVGFIVLAEFRQRRRIVARKHNAAGLDESSRRRRAEPRDDAIARHTRLAGLGIEDGGDTDLERGDTAVVKAADRPVVDGARDQRKVAFLGAREFVATIDDDDGIVTCERNRVLDCGIAGTYDENRFAVELIGIVERVLHERRLLAGTPSLRGLPCMPMASTTALAASVSPLASVMLNCGCRPLIAVTSHP